MEQNHSTVSIRRRRLNLGHKVKWIFKVSLYCTENSGVLCDGLDFFLSFTELPCLAEYVDGLWYRAKLLSITQLVPVQILVQFVDYGTYLVAPTSR